MEAVPETFVDRLGEVSLKEGMIRIELVSLSGSEPRVTRRLVMSLQAFIQVFQVQRSMVQSLERAGVLSVQPPPGSAGVSAAATEPAAAPDIAPPRSPNFSNN